MKKPASITILIFLLHLSFSNVFGQTDKQKSLTNFIGFYQKYISSVRGAHCPMYPSCSNYGMNSFKSNNVFSAFTNTSDRLLRCGHEHHFYRRTLQDNGYHLIDLANKNKEKSDSLEFKKQTPLYAWSSLTESNDSILFIEKMINNQNYYIALMEIEKYFYSKDNAPVELYINYLKILQKLERQEDAILKYEIEFPESIKNNIEIKFIIGELFLELENYRTAMKYFSFQGDSIIKPKVADKMVLYRSYIYAKQFRWTESLNELNYKNSHYEDHFYNNIRVITDASRFKNKKPWLGGALGIVPGMGYYYASHKHTAISAFILNSLFGYAVYSSVKKENYGVAALAGVFSFSFYIGSITGSVKAVKRYNISKKNVFIDKIALPSH